MKTIFNGAVIGALVGLTLIKFLWSPQHYFSTYGLCECLLLGVFGGSAILWLLKTEIF